MIARFAQLVMNERGAVAIETALVLPSLLLMSLGGFEASMMYARQMDLQNAAAEAAQIALAAAPTDAAARATVQSVLMTTTGLAADKVSVDERYRCSDDTIYVDSSSDCASDESYARFIRIEIKDTYTPSWAALSGLSAVNFDVVRMVQVG